MFKIFKICKIIIKYNFINFLKYILQKYNNNIKTYIKMFYIQF